MSRNHCLQLTMSLKVFLIVLFLVLNHLSRGQGMNNSKYRQFSHIKTNTLPEVQAQAVKDLISRLIPKYSSFFDVVVNSSLGPKDLDTFEYASTGKTLVISGTSGVASALGFQHFLKYHCNAHVSWSGDQLKIPEPFPVVRHEVRITSSHRFRYYQNVCTVSYSFVWWNWTRWEREIDWMAMNGINLPLAFNGQEAIWQRVYLKMGLTQQELDEHFGGPAFLAWARMGNMRGWGGPLPPTWHKVQLNLQHKIVQRMRAFGMTPVLPGFAGHVPEGLIRVYPKANVSRLGEWGHFNATYCCTYLLEPRDPLFKQIGEAFIKELVSEFGTNHIYNADTFNEMTPRSSDPIYLSNASRAVYDGMIAGDPNAVWLMQGWLFQDTGFWKPPQIKELLQGVPLGQMIVLDLYAEVRPVWQRTESFYGQPFIWCMLHNFGGNLGLYGNFKSVTSGPINASKHPGSTMIGTGLTPEGIEQNDVVYELMNEMGWRSVPVEIENWIEGYSQRRYGGSNQHVVTAWSLLADSVYNCTDGHADHSHSVVVMRPALHLRKSDWYTHEDVYKAWDGMILAADSFESVETFRYDLVDVTRQSLQQVAATLYSNLITAYKNKSEFQVKAAGASLLELFDDLDSILSSNQYFLLGHWLNSAKALATNQMERELYEYNARNQVTLWGPVGNIDDYANKMWGGLVKDYYKSRWELFVSFLTDALSQGKKFDVNKFNEELLVQESQWTHGYKSFPDFPVGDSVAISQFLHFKYRPKPSIHS